MNDFFKAIRSFLMEYLPRQRCFSDNTIRSYKVTLNLLVEFLREHKSMHIEDIGFGIFDQLLVLEYLDWLQQERKNSPSTRNQRLMALRSFFAYAGSVDCTQVALQLEVKSIKPQKEPGRIVDFLSEDALKCLLNQPDTNRPKGVRNLFFMILMYDTGARCGELLTLTLDDLKVNRKHPSVHLNGKGRKIRPAPIMEKTRSHCQRYLQLFHPNGVGADLVFYTVTHGKRNPLSADAVAAFMKKYGECARKQCPEVPPRVHPHQLRHTRAIHYYRDGVPLPLIAEFLGHVSVETTRIYAYADTEMKRAALEKADRARQIAPTAEAIWLDNEEMILKLSGLK